MRTVYVLQEELDLLRSVVTDIEGFISAFDDTYVDDPGNVVFDLEAIREQIDEVISTIKAATGVQDGAS